MASSHFVLTHVPGGSALSGFRARALLTRLQQVQPNVTGVDARYVHWVASTRELDDLTRDLKSRSAGAEQAPVDNDFTTSYLEHRAQAPDLDPPSEWPNPGSPSGPELGHDPDA